MKEILNVFKPEISPIHKVGFSIAAIADFTGLTGIVPAGLLLKGDALNVAKVSKSTGADATGILMHDVEIVEGVTEYAVGVMIQGVVYSDVMTLANTEAAVTAAKPVLTKVEFYGVKTLKK